jgi:hypothetical protein
MSLSTDEVLYTRLSGRTQVNVHVHVDVLVLPLASMVLIDQRCRSVRNGEDEQH